MIKDERIPYLLKVLEEWDWMGCTEEDAETILTMVAQAEREMLEDV